MSLNPRTVSLARMTRRVADGPDCWLSWALRASCSNIHFITHCTSIMFRASLRFLRPMQTYLTQVSSSYLMATITAGQRFCTSTGVSSASSRCTTVLVVPVLHRCVCTGARLLGEGVVQPTGFLHPSGTQTWLHLQCSIIQYIRLPLLS